MDDDGENRARWLRAISGMGRKVVAGGGEGGACAVVFSALEAVSFHAVLSLEMADDGLDGGTALRLTPDGGCDALDLARDLDSEAVA